MKKLFATFTLFLVMVSSLSDVSAGRSLRPDYDHWQMDHSSENEATVTPSSLLGDRYIGQYQWNDQGSLNEVHFQLVDTMNSKIIGQKTFVIAKNPSPRDQQKLLIEFFSFWDSIKGSELVPTESRSKGDQILNDAIAALVPSADAALIEVGAGMLLGVGFVAFIIGRSLAKIGGGSDLGAGLDIIGGLIGLGGAGAMVMGGITLGCQYFLR